MIANAIYSLLLSLLFTLCFLPTSYAGELFNSNGTQSTLYRVIKISDGDTIIVERMGKIRLLGINTPEIARDDRRAEPLGDEAHKRLKNLLQGESVYLEFDQKRRDRFGRLLAHVYLDDGTSINETLLRDGLARALFLQPNMKHLRLYYEVEAEAQKLKKGIWSIKEYQLRPLEQAMQCIRQFCRLHGKVSRVETKRHYTYIQMSGKLQLSIANRNLQQFKQADINPDDLQGAELTARGWVNRRRGQANIKLHHPYQIKIMND